MSLLTTSAASIHQLAAAAALAGPPPRPSIDALSSEREDGEVIKNWWGTYNTHHECALSGRLDDRTAHAQDRATP